MVLYIIIIFAMTALGGLLLASKVLTGKQAPWPLSIIHALLGATGLVLLCFAAIGAAWPTILCIALAVLVIAALGGFYLASFHVKGMVTPKGVVIIHAGAAVAGLLILLAAYVA
jgi:hypothetical protein